MLVLEKRISKFGRDTGYAVRGFGINSRCLMANGVLFASLLMRRPIPDQGM
jgi:hypothetical protein